MVYVNAICRAEPDYLLDLEECLLMKWRTSHDCTSVQVKSFQAYVYTCHGSVHSVTVQVKENLMTFPLKKSECESGCIIRFEESSVCTLFNNSKQHKKCTLCMMILDVVIAARRNKPTLAWYNIILIYYVFCRSKC